MLRPGGLGSTQVGGGQRRSGHKWRLPALSRALVRRGGSDRLGALSELVLERAQALQGSKEGSLQLSLAAWGWGALGPVWV